MSMEKSTTLRADRIDVGPLREAFLNSGVKATEVALRLGWSTSKGQSDSPRVRRALGMRMYSPGQPYKPRFVERIGYDNAIRMADAIGIDPVDVGL